MEVQREVDKVLNEHGLNKEGYKVVVEGIGFRCTQDIATVHPNLAAPFAELYLNSDEQYPYSTFPSRLMFRTRPIAGLEDLPQVHLDQLFYKLVVLIKGYLIKY